jgi:hypothetical protein
MILLTTVSTKKETCSVATVKEWHTVHTSLITHPHDAMRAAEQKIMKLYFLVSSVGVLTLNLHGSLARDRLHDNLTV